MKSGNTKHLCPQFSVWHNTYTGKPLVALDNLQILTSFEKTSPYITPAKVWMPMDSAPRALDERSEKI